MSADLFFGCYQDQEAVFIQYWSGSIKVNFIHQYQDFLQCHNRVLFLNVNKANYHIDIVKQLIKQNNYIVLLDISEVCANVPHARYMDLIRDCPELEHAPLITGGDNQSKFSVNVETFFFDTLSDNNILQAKTYTIDQIYNTNNKPHTFLYLNGANWPHRNKLWHTIEQQGLLNNSICSYLGYSSLGTACDIPLTVLDKKYESPWIDLSSSNKFQNTDVRSYVNFKPNFFRGGWVEGHVVPSQYIDTYFTLVAETVVVNNCRFVTEKTYKPLLAGHPFIALSTPGHYAYLHKLGFETWPNLIDESFDNEPNVDQRISMIAQQVQKLCNGDLDKFLQQAEPVCRHNQEHYIKYRSTLFNNVHKRLTAFFEEVTVRAVDFFSTCKDTQYV